MRNPEFLAWMDECTRLLLALYPHSPLDGTDWDEIAGDLWDDDHKRTPELAVEGYASEHDLRAWGSPDHAR